MTTQAKNFLNSKVSIHLAALFILFAGFGLRLYALDDESLWYDELLQLDIAQSPWSAVWSRLYRHSAMPLDYLIMHGWIAGGRSEAWVRLPAVIWGVLALPLVYRLGRAMLDDRAGLLLMGLLAISPFHIRYSQEVRPYALLVLGVSLAGYAFWRLRRTGRRRYGLLLFGGALIFSLAHFFALVLFIPWLLFIAFDALTASDRRPALRAGGTLIAAGGLTLIIILALGWGRTVWNVTWWGFGQALVEPERFTLEAREKPNVGAGPRVDAAFVRNQVLAPLGADSESGAAFRVFNGLALLGLAYLLIEKRYKLSLLLLLWLTLPAVVIVAFLVYRGAFYEPRYIISVLPAYLMLVAAGVLALPRWLQCAEPRWLSPGALVLICSLVVAGSALTLREFYAGRQKEDWRLVSRVIAQNAGPDDAVIAVNAESTLNWYYPPARMEPDHFDTLAAVQARVAEAERSWVVMSIFTEYIGAGEKIKVWLNEQGAVQLALDPLIDVYYLAPTAAPPQLLAEVRSFALPVDHHLYAALARQNRRDPAVARQYYQIALENAPDAATRAEYQAEIEALGSN